MAVTRTPKPPPPRPTPEHQQRLAELAAWHEQWATRHLPGSGFHPDGRPDGSDYNQHHLDVDGATPDAYDEFYAVADAIMGVGGGGSRGG